VLNKVWEYIYLYCVNYKRLLRHRKCNVHLPHKNHHNGLTIKGQDEKGGGRITLSEAYTGTTMHCVFILYNLDIMKIDYAPTESSTNTFHGNLTHARSEPNSAVTVQQWGCDAWRCTLPAAKNAISTNGRQKNGRATVRSSVARISVLIQFVSINIYALIWAICGFGCAHNTENAETCSVIKRIRSFLQN
jgi:hypothetical protein